MFSGVSKAGCGVIAECAFSGVVTLMQLFAWVVVSLPEASFEG